MTNFFYHFEIKLQENTDENDKIPYINQKEKSIKYQYKTQKKSDKLKKTNYFFFKLSYTKTDICYEKHQKY